MAGKDVEMGAEGRQAGWLSIFIFVPSIAIYYTVLNSVNSNLTKWATRSSFAPPPAFNRRRNIPVTKAHKKIAPLYTATIHDVCSHQQVSPRFPTTTKQTYKPPHNTSENPQTRKHADPSFHLRKAVDIGNRQLTRGTQRSAAIVAVEQRGISALTRGAGRACTYPCSQDEHRARADGRGAGRSRETLRREDRGGVREKGGGCLIWTGD